MTTKHATTKRDPGSGPGSNQAGQTMAGFLQQIQNAGLLRSAAVATDVATVVLCALLSTISRERARNFVSALPPTLQTLLHVCAIERSEAPEIAGREQLLRTVADRLRIELDGAEMVTRIVLAAAQTWLPRREVEDLKLQLPDDLSDVWAPRAPPR